MGKGFSQNGKGVYTMQWWVVQKCFADVSYSPSPPANKKMTQPSIWSNSDLHKSLENTHAMTIADLPQYIIIVMLSLINMTLSISDVYKYI